jgi:hypothetical protein
MIDDINYDLANNERKTRRLSRRVSRLERIEHIKKHQQFSCCFFMRSGSSAKPNLDELFVAHIDL